MSTAAGAPPPLPARVPRGVLLRWAGWFGVVNGLIFTLIGLRYLFASVLPEDGLAWFYIIAAMLSHFALLATLPMFLLLLPLILVFPRRRLVSALGILVAAITLTLVVLDTNIFVQYRYHMSALTVAIFETSTWVLAALTLASMLAFEFMLAGAIWRRCLISPRRRSGIWLAAALVVTWLSAQSVHIWADATSYVPVTQFTRVMPLYYPVVAKRRLVELGLMDKAEMERLHQINKARSPAVGQLKYPLQPMQCDTAAAPNIVFVMVDAMRRDRISTELTPTMAAFSERALDFTNHYSGGNSSRMGFFSLFYGLPSTYWQAFYSSQQAPVLMDEILRRDYQIGLFSAVGFGSPSQIDRTVFAGVSAPLRRTKGRNRLALNQAVTRDWINWLDTGVAEDGPIFGFLYYNPGAGWRAPEGVDESGLSKLERKQAGYNRGLAIIDAEVQQVLDDLQSHQLLHNTIVILVSDHGFEFDELGLGYVGHASNFSDYQLKSTLMLSWPGREPRQYVHRSAHQDLPVTLLQEAFGCSNDPTDYASGKSLFDTIDWDWIVAGSYNSHAIVQPDKVVVTYPGGIIEVLGSDYRAHAGLALDGDVARDAMLEMRRFYR